jgi:hypothetical protein
MPCDIVTSLTARLVLQKFIVTLVYKCLFPTTVWVDTHEKYVARLCDGQTARLRRFITI